MGISYNELLYLDVMKTLCKFLDRIRNNTNGKPLERDIEYWSWKYHYIEKVWAHVIYGYSDTNPLDIIKDIIERANAKMF